MWSRDLEVTLALWLLVSPFVFAHPDDAGWWATDLVCGVAMLTFALLSRWRPMRRAHLLNLVLVAWLVGYGWARAPAPAAQNELVVGFLLLLVAVIPTEANTPPRGWRGLAAGGAA